jgi:hypothetical protein
MQFNMKNAGVSAIFCAILMAHTAYGQTGGEAADGPDSRDLGGLNKVLTISETAKAPKIDGSLDDEAWQNAARFDDLYQVEPEEFAAPSRRTEVFVTFTKDALYIAAHMYDGAPELIRASQLINGAGMRSDDTFAINLDPFLSGRSGYAFFMNANGARNEAIFENIQNLNLQWRGIWRVESRVVEDGWIAEVEIPFKTLNFDPSSDKWGFSVVRRIRRENERVVWTSRNRETNPSSFGTLSGLEGHRQGLGLDLKPSISFSETRFHDEGLSDFDTEPSMTAFYKITPSLTAVLTANTDFSDAAVDDRVVNLSRFSLFLPEQRDFFLQDADIFRFGGLDGNGTPFFSRRIGLDEGGEPVQLNIGGKLTGRVGRLNLGVLDVIQSDHLDGDDLEIDRGNLFVGRATMNLMEESNIGIIATHGAPNSNDENMLGGLDFHYRNSNFIGGKTLDSNFWIQQSATDGNSSNAAAYGFGMNIQGSQGLWLDAWYQAFEDNFDPALGFANRTGIHTYGIVSGYQFRFNNSWIRSLTPVIVLEQTVDDNWNLESETLALQPFWIRTSGGYEYRFRVRHETEVLVDGFEIFDNVTIDPGQYKGYRTNLMFSTPNSNPIAIRSEWDIGEFFGGNRHSIDTGLEWRPNKHFLFGMGYSHHDIDLLNGDFVYRLATLRANIAFSTKWSWRNYIQYDNGSNSSGLNSRVEWSPQAGRSFIFIFDHLVDVEKDWALHSNKTQGTFKVNYTLRY